MSRNVLVVAVHPDDETIGCGGTLLKHKKNGDKIHWLIITSTKNSNNFDATFYSKRKLEIEAVANEYKFDSVTCLDFPAGDLSAQKESDMVSEIKKTLAKTEPNVVYLPFFGDPHSDHRVTFNLTWSALKTFRCPSVQEIYAMEVGSETDFANPTFGLFNPNTFVDISEFIDRKCQILDLYKGEVAKHPFPRSIEGIRALAIVRGAASGRNSAEAFMMLKTIK